MKIAKFFILISLLILTSTIKLKQDKKRKKTGGDNLGDTLYTGQVVTQSMKRPQKWFFNIILQKPNEKYFKEAEYNGLRYQTELLQDNLDREYNDYIREFYDDRLNIAEQKLIRMAKETSFKKK
jgi:hypothetical protein